MLAFVPSTPHRASTQATSRFRDLLQLRREKGAGGREPHATGARTGYVVLAIVQPCSVLQLLQQRQNVAHSRGRLVAVESGQGAQCEPIDPPSKYIQVHFEPERACRLSQGGSGNCTADVAALQVRRARLKLQSEQMHDVRSLRCTCSQQRPASAYADASTDSGATRDAALM